MQQIELNGLICAALLCSAGGGAAATRYVNVSNATPAAPYTNWSLAATNIQTAVNAADHGDEILVAPGIYYLSGSAVQVPEILPPNKTLILRSTQSRAAIIDAQHLSPGLLVYGTNCLIEGFTIRNGSNDTYAGGVMISEDSQLRDCLVVSNYSRSGGGGIMIYAAAVVDHCTIQDNIGGYLGGGVLFYAGTTGRLCNSVIQGNTITNVNGNGGGIYMQHAGTVSNCWVLGNHVLGTNGDGGGVFLTAEDITNGASVVNAVIAGNSTGDEGGGLWSQGPAGALFSVVNCTIVSNFAGREGGGVFAYTTRFINDIVYFNAAPTNADLNTHDASHSCIISNCCTPTTNYPWPCITNAPAFANPGAGNYQLATASFCIDAGTTNGAPGCDILGSIRPRIGMPSLPNPANTNADIGAYEYGFHFNRIQPVSSNAMQFWWDVQDAGRYQLDISTNFATAPLHPDWNNVLTYAPSLILGVGQYAVYTTTVTNPAPPVPPDAVFRLRVDRATPAKRRLRP